MDSPLFITSPQNSSSRALIFFIPGNPGLIHFYTPFLTLLSSLLSSSTTPSTTDGVNTGSDFNFPSGVTTAYDIYGQDLLGFTDSSHEPFSSSNPPRNLEAQICAIQAAVEEQGQGYEYVVLMGHSVGAYIAVETFSRWTQPPSSNIALRNGVLLFPTLIHIAQSPSGRKLLGLSKMKPIADNAHVVAKALLSLVPIMVLRWVLGRVMGFTSEAAGITAGWLKSRDGVRQALFLGMDEMKSIGENKWEDDLWEVASTKGKGTPRFWLFYAEEDHWVDGKGRDEFLEKLEGRVRVQIEGGGVKHAFCTKEWDSWVVAKKVAEWFGEIEGKGAGNGKA